MRITYSDMESDDNYFKLKFIDNITAHIVLIKMFQLITFKKIFSITTQKYYCGYCMEDSVNYLTLKIRLQKR